MELPFYDTFYDFKEYYEDNLVKDPDLSRLELLREYQKIYTDKGNEYVLLFSEYTGKLFHLANDYNFYISRLNLTNEIPQTFISGAHGLIVNQIVKELRHRKAEITKLDLEFISDHCKQYQKLCKDLDVVNWNLKNIDQILNLIAEQINFEKMTIKMAPGKEPETILEPIPEPEETPEEKDAKVKFILLKELGIIDLLISQNYNNADIGKILLPITQIKKSYTENILTADFKFPDITNAKTAYKKKNILRALDEVNKMGIGFEQLKYLPKIKTENPNLFEKE